MSDYSKSFFSLSSWKQRVVFWSGAILIGALIALMSLLSEWAAQIYRELSLTYFWFNFLIPPFGLAFTVWLTFRFFPGSEGSGIPQVKTALEIPFTFEDRRRLISFRIAIGKMFLPILGLLSGASVGFGGPATHVGASLMASLGKLAHFPAHYMSKGLLLAGSAAGFAAMFTAPLGGIMFAIEEMGRTLEERISTLVLTAIIFAGITAYSILQHTIYFADNPLSLPFGKGWLAIPLCGIVGGLSGGLFSFIIIRGKRFLKTLKLPLITIAFTCGCFIALFNFLSDGSSVGTGYQMAKDIMHGDMPLDPLFPLYKMLATFATFFSGIPSGIFVPSIATGAGIGANLAHWFPIAPAPFMILLTVTAYFSGVLQSPLTAFVVILEMTHSHEISIPLMAAAFIASATAKLINPQPLYRALCATYTIHMPPIDETNNEAEVQK